MKPENRFRNPQLWIAVALAVLTLSVFLQARSFDFISFDDPEYVAGNAQVKRGLTPSGVLWAFTSYHHHNWHPLTWLSLMIDAQVFGLKPSAFHMTNVLLHVLNVLLLFWVLRRMTQEIWPSAFAAALFAIHPLHVESVAWVSERKDVLSTLFWLLTLLAYVRYVERPGRARYAFVALFLGMGLMTKQMLMTLPFVLLLLDYWPLNRLRSPTPSLQESAPRAEEPEIRKKRPRTRKEAVPASETPSRAGTEPLQRPAPVTALIWEKIPLLILAAAAGVVVLVVQLETGAVKSMVSYSLATRIENAVLAYVLYLFKTVWPVDLVIFYPHPGDSIPAWQVGGAALLLGAITAACIACRSRRYLAVGWLWYLGTLIPVIGLVQVGLQAMADRYTYVPLIGIFILLSWGMRDISLRWPRRKTILGSLSVFVLCVLAVLAWKQVGTWRNSITLFEHAARSTTGNDWALTNLGFNLGQAGRYDEALVHLRDALRINPLNHQANSNVGIILASRGDLDEADAYFRKSLEARPDYMDARKNLALTLLRQNRMDEARTQLQEAIRFAPRDASIRFMLGRLELAGGNDGAAEGSLSEAIRLKSDYAEAYNAMGMVMARKGRFSEAEDNFRKALWHRPDYAEARANLQRIQEALKQTR